MQSVTISKPVPAEKVSAGLKTTVAPARAPAEWKGPRATPCCYCSCSQTFPGHPAHALEKHTTVLPVFNQLPFTNPRRNASDALKKITE